jgi:hypothetical protein
VIIHCAILLAACIACAQAQSTVPFVGCESDGQQGPQKAPSGTSRQLPISAESAGRLAFYIGPRGWYCLHAYGSGGGLLMVSPVPIDAREVFSTRDDRIGGPLIELAHYNGGTSGRMNVAGLIASVFPSRMAFAREVIEMFPFLADTFHDGPYPSDHLTRKGDNVVEYETPAQAEGLGTYSKRLKKNTSPIRGVAILLPGSPPDSLLLSVRLPATMNGLAPLIMQQVERDADKAR